MAFYVFVNVGFCYVAYLQFCLTIFILSLQCLLNLIAFWALDDMVKVLFTVFFFFFLYTFL